MIYYKGQYLKVSRDNDGYRIYQGPNASEYKGYYKFDDLSKEWIQVPKPEEVIKVFIKWLKYIK